MECNLEPADRTLRIVSGVFIFLAGLLLVALAYLQLLATWWWVVAGCLTLMGVCAILSAVTGRCRLRGMLGH